MKVASILAVARALQEAEVKYLVVGGVAVNLLGYHRTTKDLDLVIQLEPTNLLKGLQTLESLGYRPKLPVKWEDFCNPETRESWIEDRNMIVFQLWSDRYRETPIDVFVREPFDFEVAYQRALFKEVEPGLAMPLTDIETLIELKLASGRDRDLADVTQLRNISAGL